MAAINFSTASFAACLAAGLKVPRHVMYCIAQDTGTPYVIYNKDGTMQAAPGGGMGQHPQWAPQSTPTTGYALIAPSPTPQPHFHQVHIQAAPPPVQITQTSGGNPTQNSAPAISQTVTHSTTSKPNVASRDSSTQPNTLTSSESQTNGAATTGSEGEPAQSSSSSELTYYNASQNSSTGQSTPTSQNTPRPPSTMLSPNSFMTYLKQPGVMVTSVNGTELTGATSGEFPNMPDLLTQNPNVARTTKDLRLFKCDTCGRAFRQKSTLLQHERIHTDSRPYPCAECGKRFRQQSHLSQHVRIHANERPYNYGATIGATINAVATGAAGPGAYKKSAGTQAWSQPGQDCSYPTNDKDSGYENNEASAPGYSPAETNATFPAYFKDEKGVAHGIFNQAGKCLPDVIQNGKTSGMPLYVRCPICQKEFKQKSTLLQHGCVHIESRPYPCGDCGKRFRQQSHLVQHLRIHNDEKPYTCIYCGRQFRQRTILNQHTRIHTGEKPYKCIHCGKDFRQKAILDQHTRTHLGERPFCCPLPNCRRRFCTEGEVKRHIDNHMTPNNRKTKRSGSPSSVSDGTITIKPELYFPHTYPSGYATVQYGVQTSPQEQTGIGEYDSKREMA